VLALSSSLTAGGIEYVCDADISSFWIVLTDDRLLLLQVPVTCAWEQESLLMQGMQFERGLLGGE
jgi:hypothetical protein